MMTFTLKWIFFTLMLCAISSMMRVGVVKAAHSRRRLVTRRDSEPRYDRSITTFSPDGRLLQVEYGMEAANRGSTVIALASKDKVCVVVPSSHEIFRIDEHVWLFACGLLGDSRFLASRLRNMCQRFRLSYGEAPTVKEVAKFAAQTHHDLTRYGGARPLGCSAILVGISNGRPQLYRTGPGGVMEECNFCAAGKDRSKIFKALAEIYEQISIDASDEEESIIQKIEYKMARAMIDTLEMDNDERNLNVWTIQPNARRRGKSQATCYLDVNRKCLPKLDSLDIKNTVKLEEP